MLNTSHGYVPWDDLHHPALSTTNGEHDGRWVFGNANNTPRVARIDLKTFRTAEIDRKSTRLNSSHIPLSRMPSSA